MGRLTPSQENYLEWIYRFSVEGPVRVRDLQRRLGVQQSSVSRAVAALKKRGLIRHESYGDIELSEEGRRLGEQIVRRDRILTRFLTRALGMGEEAADAEVHQLEHVVSDALLDRLDALTDYVGESPDWAARRDALGRDSRGASDDGQEGLTFRLHAGSSHEKRVASEE